MSTSERKFTLSALLVPSIVAVACSNGSPEIDHKDTHLSTYLGATVTWDLTGVPWKDEVQLIRKRAYLFCFQKYPKDEHCPNEQDFSIKVAVDVERGVREVIRDPTKADILGVGEQFGEAISMQPKLFDDARTHCFSIYRDSGSADARFLGPCMASTVGWDYFGFLPVP